MGSNAIATQASTLSVVNDDPIMRDTQLWRVVSSGDLAGLSDEQKAAYYLFRCRQEGLNPASQPFVYMKQQGKEILYGGKTAADQLRKLHGITLRIVSKERIDDVYVVTVEATAPDGRTDSDIGAVTLGNLKGDALANALMKAITKAKRRATYSICGTGVLDETELDTIPGVQRLDADPAASAAPVREAARSEPLPMAGEVVDQQTGEILTPRTPQIDPKQRALELAELLREKREGLGWSVAALQAVAANEGHNLRTNEGLEAMWRYLSDLSAVMDRIKDTGDQLGWMAMQVAEQAELGGYNLHSLEQAKIFLEEMQALKRSALDGPDDEDYEQGDLIDAETAPIDWSER